MINKARRHEIAEKIYVENKFGMTPTEVYNIVTETAKEITVDRIMEGIGNDKDKPRTR